MNKDLWIGCNIWSILSASLISLSVLDLEYFWKSEHNLGAIFAVTEIIPTPPLLLNSRANPSSPVNWIKSGPSFFRVASILFGSPVASFTPAIFFNSNKNYQKYFIEIWKEINQ